ncbi:MAG: methionyl-tRNA formyltransferase, partial [Burkholderiales bacterium]
MRIVFAGTPAFAAIVLARLLDARHGVALVLTQPDRPGGRGLKLLPGPVKQLAVTRKLQIFQPASLKDPPAVERIAAARPEAIVTAAYGLILPARLLDLAPHGALNVHASLLPRWRGAAPIQRALLAGDRESGITIIRMDTGLDTGPIVAQRAVPIADEDDAQSLHDKLAALGGGLIVAVLENLSASGMQAGPQPAAGVTYAAKIASGETELDWSRPAWQLERAVRAFRPA